ncbi:MAG: pentapeptide repeat-containing protein [Gemmatimonadaceae bacterium]
MADRKHGAAAPATTSTITGADWDGRDISEEKHESVLFVDLDFLGSMFDRCTFDTTQVVGGNWSHVGLPGVDLRSATFSGVRMREADLTGARCQGSSLRDVDLTGAWLHRVDFTDCDLRGCDLSALVPDEVELRGAIVTYNQPTDKFSR